MRPHHIAFYVSTKPTNLRNPAEIQPSQANTGRRAMSEISTGHHHDAGRYETRLREHARISP
jgi:hypothetical protein